MVVTLLLASPELRHPRFASRRASNKMVLMFESELSASHPRVRHPCRRHLGKGRNFGLFPGCSDTRDGPFFDGSEQIADSGPNVSGERRWWSHSVSRLPGNTNSDRSTGQVMRYSDRVTGRASVRMRSAADPSRRECLDLVVPSGRRASAGGHRAIRASAPVPRKQEAGLSERTPG